MKINNILIRVDTKHEINLADSAAKKRIKLNHYKIYFVLGMLLSAIIFCLVLFTVDKSKSPVYCAIALIVLVVCFKCFKHINYKLSNLVEYDLDNETFVKYLTKYEQAKTKKEQILCLCSLHEEWDCSPYFTAIRLLLTNKCDVLLDIDKSTIDVKSKEFNVDGIEVEIQDSMRDNILKDKSTLSNICLVIDTNKAFIIKNNTCFDYDNVIVASDYRVEQ